jgi:TorA maturation chaperone TorD
MTRPHAAAAALRTIGDALDLLAEVFLRPGADVRRPVAELASRPVLRQAPLAELAESLLALAGAPESDRDPEFVRLFLHGRPVAAHPYESFYRGGQLDDVEVLTDLAELYAAAGVRPEAGHAVPLDHLGAELDLLALLLHGLAGCAANPPARAALAELAGRLLHDHLEALAAAFTARLAGAAPAPYYRAAARALLACVTAAGSAVAASPDEDGTSINHQETDNHHGLPLRRQKEEMKMRVLTTTLLAGLMLMPVVARAQQQAAGEDAQKLRADIQELEDRLDKVEKKAAKDRINFSGDFRFEMHSIQSSVPEHFDGMALQKGVVDTFFYYGSTGQLPQSPQAVQQFIAQNYGSYLYFTNGLTYQQLQQAMGQLPPAMVQQLMGSLLPYTHVAGYDVNNTALYTNRLRLNMGAEVAENVKFTGRLSMYKVFGDSTGVQVFNGQANSFDIDGNTVGVPNGDALRVERAYFDWTKIGGSGLYLSIGRRPSSGGPPMHLRQGDLREGSPMGSLIDFQFDGVTVGYHINEYSTARICWGLGYESGFGNGEVLKQPADRLKDAQFAGLNWDLYQDDAMLAQITIARAFNLTDGFNGLVVLPNNPLTGQAIGAPLVMRFTPSANLGDMDIMGAVFMRTDGPVDWFANFNYVKSHPNEVTTPFGGMFTDPFQVPESHSGSMYYLGARYNLPNGKTMIGAELNHGSEYWFSFTPAQDDIIAPKTNTRGDVYELYVIHKIRDRFLFRLGYIDYSYDYSGSGWHIGAPKKLDASPVLGFPTYDSAKMVTATFTVKF